MERSGNQWGGSRYRVLHHVHTLNRGLKHNVNICYIWEYAPGASTLFFIFLDVCNILYLEKETELKRKKITSRAKNDING